MQCLHHGAIKTAIYTGIWCCEYQHMLLIFCVPSLTEGPGIPWRPGCPRRPFKPLSPLSPATPFSPRGPAGPYTTHTQRHSQEHHINLKDYKFVCPHVVCFGCGQTYCTYGGTSSSSGASRSRRSSWALEKIKDKNRNM